MNKNVVKIIVVLLLVIVIGGIIFILINNNSNNTNQTQRENTRNENIENYASTDLENVGTENPEENTEDSSDRKILVAYYSYTGNTEEFANVIADETGGTLFEIQRAEDYSNLYTEAEEEINNNDRPELAEMPENVEQYDTIFVGYPIWWDRTPAMINTFLENINLDGKNIIPFCTSSSDSIEGSMTDIRSSAEGANILDGLRLSGSSVESSRSTIDDWLSDLGF